MKCPMLFLHGWGQSRQVWQQQMQPFPAAEFLNLPGHGGAAESDDWVESIAAQLLDAPALLVGWSLGGAIAMQLALQHPEKVAALTLVSTTPLFCQQAGWKHGCTNELFEAFSSGVQSNSAKTMGRFFTLMLHGDGLARSEQNHIAINAIDKSMPPSSATLAKGLDYLEQTDLRQALRAIKQPTLVLHGMDDAIIPVAAGEYLANTLPNAAMHLFERCGHAPFLTQSKLFNETLEQWCQTI